MRRHSEEGATALEFAVILLIVVTTVFSAIYAATYYFYSAAASHVARAVARDASLPEGGGYPTVGDERRVADHAAGRLLPSPTSVALNPHPNAAEGNLLTVTVTYNVPGLRTMGALFPFLPHKDGKLTKTVTVRYE